MKQTSPTSQFNHCTLKFDIRSLDDSSTSDQCHVKAGFQVWVKHAQHFTKAATHTVPNHCPANLLADDHPVSVLLGTVSNQAQYQGWQANRSTIQPQSLEIGTAA